MHCLSSTKRRRNRVFKPQFKPFPHQIIEPEFQEVRNDEFTVFKTLEKNISELPYEPGYEILQKASEDYLGRLNTPISQTNEPTIAMPDFMNHGNQAQNVFYVFEAKHLKQLRDHLLYWDALRSVTFAVCLMIGALIISWKINS